MSKDEISILVLAIYLAMIFVVAIVWMLISPEDDLGDIVACSLFWPIVVISLALFFPFKVLILLQKQRLEHIAKKKFRDEHGYDEE